MTELCIPYLDDNLAEKYLLYTVAFDEESVSEWNVRNAKLDKTASKKIKGLQKYFEKRHYSHLCPGEFEIRTLNPVPADDGEGEVHKYVTEVNN